MEKKLTEMTVAEFIDTLASSAPAPGGGSAAALAVWVYADLVKCSSKLTAGKLTRKSIN